ncbi:hypothetical protein cypCar_00022399 [Cyprinus carpio]|nr:hypothetical protein cypCar_00022399 [Cyprinus carpio]
MGRFMSRPLTDTPPPTLTTIPLFITRMMWVVEASPSCDPHHIPVSRSKWKVNQSKTSCLLHLHADHRFFKCFESVEAVVAQVASYMKAINDIYDKADFDGIELVNFKVKFLSVGRSMHDEGSDSRGLEISCGKGKFFMFPQASYKIEENSDKFSPCSLRCMSHILNINKDKCFVVSEQPICGNRIVEEGEECDVGHDESDHDYLKYQSSDGLTSLV